MCVNIVVTMPALKKFLFVCDLCQGCWAILLYTSFRAFIYLFIMVTAMLEMLVNQSNMKGYILINTPAPKVDEVTVYYLFFCYLVLIISETFLLVFLLHLYIGLMTYKSHHLKYYLVCRFFVWLFESTCLVMLAIKHYLLIGWYLMMLLFIILDLYFFVVVYSYYVYVMMLLEDRRKPQYQPTSSSTE